MASIVWRRAKQQVYVYYYDSAARKTKQVPREFTEKWDKWPREEVEAAVAKWLRENGLAAHRVARKKLHESDSLSKLWAGYQRQAKIKKKGGARRIRELILKMEGEASLLGYLPDRHFKWWSRYGLAVRAAEQADVDSQKLSLKDLRRASIYWLGHHTTMDVIALKQHARHKEARGELDPLDLDEAQLQGPQLLDPEDDQLGGACVV